MVQVTLPKRVKRPARRSRKLDYERVAAATMGLIGTMVFVYLVLVQPGSSAKNGSGEGSLQSRLLDKLRHNKKNHPDLKVQDPNSAAYDAIAQDIITTLDCGTLFATESGGLGGGGDGGDPFHEMDDIGGIAAFHEGSNDVEKKPVADQDVAEGVEEVEDINRRRRRRRLEEQDPNAENGAGVDFGADGGNNGENELDFGHGDVGFDDIEGFGEQNRWNTVNAKHLFCLAANAEPDEKLLEEGKTPINWNERVQCKAGSPERQRFLLDLWSSARTEMTTDILIKTLEVAQEQTLDLAGRNLNLWAPTNDDGIEYMMNTLNQDKNADEGGIHGLGEQLGAGKLFVDVGSCLGLTSIAVAILYPNTEIISIEAAAPNWLLQEINWQCNDEVIGVDTVANVDVLLGGVGPQAMSTTGTSKVFRHGKSSTQMAKFTWRPHATTSARSWTAKSEATPDDVELTVKLRPWRELLKQADIASRRIDVLNVDCEGCEYNLIPALTDAEFDSISTVMGGVHWGYIPAHKLPSSERGSKTHKRLCQHENIARQVKECCAFPDLAVTSSVPGEVLVQDSKEFPPKSVTVKEIAGELCNGFDEWAKEKMLNDIESDWGWFQISSTADL